MMEMAASDDERCFQLNLFTSTIELRIDPVPKFLGDLALEAVHSFLNPFYSGKP